MSRQKLTGDTGEEFVCGELIKNGYEIKARNYRIKGGEIDIIALKDDTLAVVEVKTRKVNSLVSGVEAMTVKKRDCIIKAARRYLFENECELYVRFDVAEVTVTAGENPKVIGMNYYENAFDATDAYTY